MSLDDDALAAFESDKAAKERKYARNVKGDEKPPYDFYMVQEILVEYDKCARLTEAVRKCGGNESECIEAKKWDAEIKLVWNFVEERIVDRMRARAKEIAQDAQEGLSQLVTDAECKLNPKAIKMALEGTVPELYGGGGGKAGADEEADERRKLPMNGGIMINIIGDAAAKLMEPKAGGRAGGVFIDV